MRRFALALILLWFGPALWQVDFSWMAGLRPASSPPVDVPSPIPNARVGAGMSAQVVEQLLRTAPASRQAPRDVHCAPGQNGWDYACTYLADAPHPQSRLKIGVRVSATAIVQASAPHPLDRPLPRP